MIVIHEKNSDVFSVTVTGRQTTRHVVTITDDVAYQLTNHTVTKKQLLEFSFEFLLARESNVSILSSFDLMLIEQYFPDYKQKVKQWCNIGKK